MPGAVAPVIAMLQPSQDTYKFSEALLPLTAAGRTAFAQQGDSGLEP